MKLQLSEGLGKRTAAEKASIIHLHPILKTSISLIVAIVPLIAATGAGAVSRSHIGLTIAASLGIGTPFTRLSCLFCCYILGSFPNT